MHNQNIINNSSNISKSAWKIINKSKKEQASSSKILLTENGKLFSDPLEVANIFNKYYINVPSVTSISLPKTNLNNNFVNRNPKSIFMYATDEKDV